MLWLQVKGDQKGISRLVLLAVGLLLLRLLLLLLVRCLRQT